jgi:benzoyl-CoA reductase/2-hydroxyglutaryl-CoA dehydratase subunit BcrC/BadD/HgdB
MSLVLEGRYDFLDGEVGSNTCDHVRRARDVFVKKTALPFHGFISVPRSPRESLFAYYLEEVRRLYHDLGRHLGREPSDDALREAVRALNENRRRLSEVNRLRLEDRPRLSGSDALAVHIAAQVLPPSVFGSLADRLLEALRRHPGIASPRGRLLLLGAELNEPEYVDAIESQGALVVADRLCFGARSVLEPIDDQAPDPLAAIARAYFFRPSCARMIGDFPNRWAALQSLVADARADGVVLERLLFCDPWGAEVHNLSLRAKAAGLPLLVLQRECGIVPAGQIKTRVQAFLEKLEGDRARGGAAGEAP